MKLEEIDLKINELENKIEGQYDTGVKGIMVERYIRCGKPTCKCNQGEYSQKHGPYPNIQYYDNTGKLRNLYIKKKQRTEYEEKLLKAEEFRQIIKELNKLYILKRKYIK